MEETVTPVESAENTTQPAAAPREKKSGFIKRIDKLTARNHMLEARVVELEAELTELHLWRAEMIEAECRTMEARIAAQGVSHGVRNDHHN